MQRLTSFITVMILSLIDWLSFQVENPLDHIFSNYQVNIMQSCDQCTSYIWGMEKAYMCSSE